MINFPLAGILEKLYAQTNPSVELLHDLNEKMFLIDKRDQNFIGTCYIIFYCMNLNDFEIHHFFMVVTYFDRFVLEKNFISMHPGMKTRVFSISTIVEFFPELWSQGLGV